VADSPGRYRIEVRSESKTALPGQYEIELSKVRPPTAKDRERIAAERAYAAGDELNKEESAENRRQAIGKFNSV
jgi:hypothetical protein